MESLKKYQKIRIKKKPSKYDLYGVVMDFKLNGQVAMVDWYDHKHQKTQTCQHSVKSLKQSCELVELDYIDKDLFEI